jgi:hypothetical protein
VWDFTVDPREKPAKHGGDKTGGDLVAGSSGNWHKTYHTQG